MIRRIHQISKVQKDVIDHHRLFWGWQVGLLSVDTEKEQHYSDNFLVEFLVLSLRGPVVHKRPVSASQNIHFSGFL